MSLLLFLLFLLLLFFFFSFFSSLFSHLFSFASAEAHLLYFFFNLILHLSTFHQQLLLLSFQLRPYFIPISSLFYSNFIQIPLFKFIPNISNLVCLLFPCLALMTCLLLAMWLCGSLVPSNFSTNFLSWMALIFFEIENL